LNRNCATKARKVWAQAMNMADTGSIQAAMDRVIAECGGIHGLAIGAGPMVSFEKLMDFPVEEAVRFVNEDAMGYFRLFHAVTPLLRANGGGSITTCSTFANRRILVYDGISPLSKGSVEAMVRYVAAEEGPNNIRCNAVGIGWIQPGNQDFSQIPPKPDVEPEDQLGRMLVQMREIVDMTKIQAKRHAGRRGQPVRLPRFERGQLPDRADHRHRRRPFALALPHRCQQGVDQNLLLVRFRLQQARRIVIVHGIGEPLGGADGLR
jgi:NAD(P)-dependent dehydrogenase (short-subunit alcohol dehydrogenase family)